MRKKYTILCIIIILLIILIAVLLIKQRIDNNKHKDDNEVPYDIYEAYEAERNAMGITAYDAVVQLEDNINEYCTVEGIIKSFNTNVAYLNSSAKDLKLFVTKENESKILEEYRQRGYKYIKNVLASNYKTMYSEGNEYLLNMLKDNIGKDYEITEMYVVDDSAYINTYYVYGNYDEKAFNYIIVLDRYNLTYEIYLNNYLVDNKIDKNNLNSMKTLNVKHIDENENNKFQYKNIDEEQVAKMYYSSYLNLAKNNPSRAYALLDNEYRQKKFNSEEEFKAYISKRLQHENVDMESYRISNVDNSKEVLCVDTLGNDLIFKTKGAMNYTVLLDAYTVSVKAYDEDYKNADEIKKSAICLNTFIQCIYNGDYKSAYNFLNETFKNSNFKDEQEFENYVKVRWTRFNGYSYESVKVENNDYIFTGNLYSIEDEGSYNSQVYAQKFIVRKGNSMRDFELSFEIHEK